MSYIAIPLTSDPWQIHYLPSPLAEVSFSARLDIRCLPAAAGWFLSLSDATTGQRYVNQIPLICSHTDLNDLFAPFRHRFHGAGLGTLVCLKAAESPTTPDPTRENLDEFMLFWGDTYP